MSARDKVSAPTRLAVKRIGTGQFRGASGDLNDAEVEILAVFLRIGVPSARLEMASDLVFGEIRSVKMHACHSRAVFHRPVLLHRLAGMEHRLDLSDRSCRCRRENSGGAMSRMTTIGHLYRPGGSIHVVSPIASVDVDVHVTGPDESLVHVHFHAAFRQRDIPFVPNGADATVAADDHAVIDQTVGEDNGAVQEDCRGASIHGRSREPLRQRKISVTTSPSQSFGILNLRKNAAVAAVSMVRTGDSIL